MKRAGFTMIELIFVIVILGILAAVAVPKLAATRDDAKLAAVVTQTRSALNEISSFVTARNTYDANMTVMSPSFANMAEETITGTTTRLVAIALDATTSPGTATIRDPQDGQDCILVTMGSFNHETNTSGTAWTDDWNTVDMDKYLQVTHLGDTNGGCPALTDRLSEGNTSVKGRAAQF